MVGAAMASAPSASCPACRPLVVPQTGGLARISGGARRSSRFPRAKAHSVGAPSVWPPPSRPSHWASPSLSSACVREDARGITFFFPFSFYQEIPKIITNSYGLQNRWFKFPQTPKIIIYTNMCFAHFSRETLFKFKFGYLGIYSNSNLGISNPTLQNCNTAQINSKWSDSNF